MTKYKALIGLEMHCEITETNTKVFSSARNGSKNSNTDLPNCNIRPVDMAFPGTLPVVNKECVRKSLMMSLILNCKQPEYLEFDIIREEIKVYHVESEIKEKIPCADNIRTRNF